MRQQNMNRDFATTAHTLSEALPYMQRYAGAVVVVKFGGNAMGDDDAMAEFARDIVLMVNRGQLQPFLRTTQAPPLPSAEPKPHPQIGGQR